MRHRRVDAHDHSALSVVARRRPADHDDPQTSLAQPTDGHRAPGDPGVDRDGVRSLRATLGLVGAGRDADQRERGIPRQGRRDAFGGEGLAVRDDDGADAHDGSLRDGDRILARLPARRMALRELVAATVAGERLHLPEAASQGRGVGRGGVGDHDPRMPGRHRRLVVVDELLVALLARAGRRSPARRCRDPAPVRRA